MKFLKHFLVTYHRIIVSLAALALLLWDSQAFTIRPLVSQYS